MQQIFNMKFTLFVTAFVTFFIFAQCDGPTPPRLNIPGAIPIPIRQQQIRNEKFTNAPQVVRIRRPLPQRQQALNSLPLSSGPRSIDEAKPVTEEPEDNISDPFIPQIISQSQQQQQQQQQQQFQPQQSFFAEPNSIQDSPLDDLQQISRFQSQERPSPQKLPELPKFGIERAERKPSLARSKPTPIPHRETRPQQYEQAAERRVQLQSRHQQPSHIAENHHNNNEVRNKKPVAQILRKWSEEHEDGSITWGFENDDGSFKEEMIGIDCVTRGRYGYVDPDGLKREYTYETGIPCDPNKKGQDNEQEQTGYVDYEGNKAVLPNGVEIDLSSMGKKKSKRPGAILYQQPQQQQYYRN